ncbi:lytic transglycosylase domain-containing protein [Caulobacter sp.]|uniref:lytic transglycosylase domain-containing protein n=1 Tax=Caulobacter sp. TaxID=78 RepID=UPI002B48626D|nr:lytic transglycosylase domain-containing protein [Caulobacter sp.]HJV41571.1 lytic transglycosylase domain-containing protein [Caulobacter sp.]
MASVLRRVMLGGACIIAICGVADAQTAAPDLASSPAAATSVSDTDSSTLQTALSAAKRGDVSGARAAMAGLSDPVARKIALWALVDSNAEALSFYDLDSARRDLAGWPRGARRDAATERALSTSGLDPARIIAWFGGAQPATADGAMALASAYQAIGRQQEATDLIRRTFRDKVFEADAQRAMIARFGSMLTPDDYNRRADILLYGQQGPAARDIVALLSETQQAAARVRMAYRQSASNANDLYNGLTPDLQASPGVVFERAAYLRRKGMETLALPMVVNFPAPPTEEASTAIWKERKQLVVAALKAGDSAGAYAAADNTQALGPADIAESEFYAGWIALTRLKNADLAAAHFAQIAAVGASPITKGRALYWQGRAAEAQGDPIAAQAFYAEGARYITTFYGQLSAERAGYKELRLDPDPVITPADRARFYGREQVRAARILADIGARDQFRSLVLYIDDTLPNAQESALLVDLARGYGDQDLAMRAVRTAAQRGFILAERGYPLLDHHFTPGPGAAETAFVYSISRQESNFDPEARSGVGARGMMQLMPATASLVARKLGEAHSVDRLTDASYNMRLGSVYLGQMVNSFSGSYVMAAAAYNAGPGRPAQWAGLCGDPRGASTDPLDFIECIPFSETRNYVMRTLETTMVYRARLNGGVAPLTLSGDLKRGGYAYSAAMASAEMAATAQP